MDLLKLVWRVAFLLLAALYIWPMLYMQVAFSGLDGLFSDFYSLANTASLVTSPLLIYIPVEVFFHLHKVSTSE